MTQRVSASYEKRTVLNRILENWHYLFAAILVVFFHFPLASPIGGMTGEWDDFYTLHCTSRIICADAVQHGRLPEWTSGLFNGFPIYSAFETAFWFPSNLILELLGWFPNTQTKGDWYVLGHTIFLALASTFFARGFRMSRAASVVAGLICTYNGFVTQHIGHVNLQQTIACGFAAAGLLLRMPLNGNPIAWRYATGAALFLGASILPGHAQTILYTHWAIVFGVLFGALLVWRRLGDRRPALRLLFFGAYAPSLGICLAAVQLLPNLKLVSTSERLDQSLDAVWAFGGDIRQLPSFLFPSLYREFPWDLHAYWFYHRTNYNWFGSVFYERFYPIGFVAFALGLLGFVACFKRPVAQVLFWTSMFLLGASFSTQPRLFSLLYNYLPGVKAVHCPTRHLWIVYSLCGILAGLGYDALFSRQHAVNTRQIVKRILVVIAILLSIGPIALIIARAHSTGWLDAFIKLLVIETEPMMKYSVLDHLQVFVAAITKQLVVGFVIVGIFCALIAIAGFTRRLWLRKAAGTAMVALLAMELFMYNFGAGYLPYRSPGNGFPANAFTALDPAKPPPGRVLTPGVFFGVGTINLAAVGPPDLATGYCATVPNWIIAFTPSILPPWRAGLDEALLDLACVSDVIAPASYRRVTLGEKSIRLSDAGMALIQPTSTTAEAKRYPASMVLQTRTTETIKAVHLLASSAASMEQRNGTSVGEVAVVAADGAAEQKFPLTLGENISDIDYDMNFPTSCPLHRRAKLAFKHRQDVVSEYDYLEDVCDAEFKIDPPTSATEIRITATRYPVDLLVSQVVFETSSGLKSILPPISDRFKIARTHDPRWRLWHRNDPPPIARMIPVAHAASYRKMRNVTAQLTSASYRSERDLFVNREEFSSDTLNSLNAPDPDQFHGNAKMVPTGDPRRVHVQTDSNQPGWLFLSQSWYDGWTATLDQKPTRLVRATGAYTAVHVPPGQHEVRLSFRTPWLVTGAILSSLALMLSVAMLVWPRRRSPGTSPLASILPPQFE